MRHTPDPRYVRFAMSGLLVLGMTVGLVGALSPLWSFHLSMDVTDAGQALLGLACGVALGVAASSFALGAKDKRPDRVLRWGAWVAALGLAATTLQTAAAREALPLALIGAGLGGVIRATATGLEASLTYRRASGVMHLAGVAFGFGAVGACAACWFLHNWFGWEAAALFHAAAFAAVGLLCSRSPIDAPPREVGGAIDWRSAAAPTGLLLGAGLLIQAANYGALGGWLGLYVFRKLGVTIDTSLAILALFWAAATAGRVAAARAPSSHRLSLGTAVTAVSALGALFLLNTVETSGALAGALLIGSGVGATHPLTLGAVTRRFTLERFGLVRLFAAGSLVAGFGFAWLMGPLSAAYGIDAVLWSALACSVASWVALTLIVVETRLSQSPAGAR